MTSQPRNKDRNRPGNGGQFTHKDQTAPDSGLSAGQSEVAGELATTDDESKQARNSAGRMVDLTPVYEYLSREYGTEIDDVTMLEASYEYARVEDVVLEQSQRNGQPIEIAILQTDQASVAVPANLALPFVDEEEPGRYTFRLTDGRAVSVPEELRERFRGVDSDGDIVVADDDMRRSDGTETLYPLTSCCHATGQGWEVETGVVCRGCYSEVDPKYGGFHDGPLIEPA